MRRKRLTSVFLLCGLLCFLIQNPAAATSGSGLLLKGWGEGDRFEIEIGTTFQASGNVKSSTEPEITINRYEASGRFRFRADGSNPPAVGFDLYHIDLDHTETGLPTRLRDQSIGAGFGVGKWGHWRIGVTLGGGVAGDEPYSDGDAWYLHGNLIALKSLGEATTLQLTLNHDGSRTLFPDIPLPAVAYHHRVSDRLNYTLGLPYNALHWEPLSRLTLDLDYTPVFNINTTVSLELVTDDFLNLYVGFYNDYNGFHLEDDDPNRRVFFQERQVELGMRIGQQPDWKITVAGGYALDQLLERGWDVRDVSTVAEFSDEPYLSVEGAMSF